IGRVRALALQPDRLARHLLELGDRRRLLVEQALDDARARQHEELLEIELAVLPQYLSENLVADGLGGFDEPAALTARTRLAKHVFQALAIALTRHLDEPERRDVHDLALGVVAREPVREHLQHLAAVLLFGHVDEIDDDDAAEVAQPELPRNRGRRLEIRAIDRLFEVPMPNVG